MENYTKKNNVVGYHFIFALRFVIILYPLIMKIQIFLREYILNENRIK